MNVDLIERAKAGDADAFAEIAASRIDALFAVARLILRDQHLAEDAVQETLIRCWRQLPKLRNDASFDAGYIGSCIGQPSMGNATEHEESHHKELNRDYMPVSTAK